MSDNIQQPKLTGKQTAFIQHYLGDSKFNATDAARKAGYKGNENTLNQTANKLVRNGKIRALLDAKAAETTQNSEITVESIAKEIRSIAFGTAGLTYRLRALELLGRYRAMFTDKVENLGDGLTINVKGREEKADKEVERPILKLHTGTDDV